MTPEIGDIWLAQVVCNKIVRGRIPARVLLLDSSIVEGDHKAYSVVVCNTRWNVLVLDTGDVVDIMQFYLAEKLA